MSVVAAIGANAAALVASEGQGGLLSVHSGLAFWTTITFILLLIVLGKFAWKPILAALKTREDKIREGLDAAEKARQEAEEMIEKNKEEMRKAEERARETVEESRKYADEIRERTLEQSKEQAKKMLDDAEKRIEAKQNEAFEELKNRVADLSVEIAEKLLRESLDKDKQKALASKLIDDLPKN